MRWSRLVLLGLLVFDVWYRAHTFGPTVRDGLGLNLWPATIGAGEPLDCDEAAYAYIGHRILSGDVLYRDVTENKTPLGYWLYTLAVASGGYNELAIRIMPIPFVLLTIGLVWWVAGRLGGQLAACLAAGLYVLLSTDPYLFGNGANMEHFVNLFSVASLALLIFAWDRSGRWPLFAAGVCLGAAALVKQFAIFPIAIFGPALLLRAGQGGETRAQRIRRSVVDVVVFGLGVLSIAALSAMVVVVQGAGRDAYDDIFLYGRALATDTLPDPAAPAALIRWITGNADPRGGLPWPFGVTTYLVWWGTASWPFWLVSIPSLAWLLINPWRIAGRRLTAGWAIAAWAQVALPGLYWQHYYLLPTAGASIAVAVCYVDALLWCVTYASPRAGGAPLPVAAALRSVGNRRGMMLGLLGIPVLAIALGATVFLEVTSYLLVPPEELTIRYKGGRQWVELRNMGRELSSCRKIWKDPHLYIWGWQSPLHFYGRIDSPSRHFFVDNLLRDQADRDHRLIRPRTQEIMATLERHPPELILTAYPPFRALKAFLNDRYLPSVSMGLWVRQDCYRQFEPPGRPTDRRQAKGKG
jgi:4-amino-4-deoxy-L-arabinose transferase-like glycosyltransferase